MKTKQLIIKNSFLTVFVVLSCVVYGQQVTFNKVPLPEGKTFDFVTGINQDNMGIMWFSTKTGLFSYDGNQLAHLKNNPSNPNSLSSILLESIYADTDGNIWTGTLGNGLEYFNPVTGNFTHFKHDRNNPESIANDTVTSILRDKEGILWIGTHQGLDQFDAKTNKFLHFKHFANDNSSLSNNQVRVIYEDKEGTLWIGTGSPYADNGGGPDDGGLNRMDKKTGTFTRFLYNQNNSKSLINNKISAIFEDDKGVLWIGTAKSALHKMNRQEGTFERILYDPSNPKKLSGPPITPQTPIYEHITFFTQDAAGSYWFGTVDAGIYCYNPQIGSISHFQGTQNPLMGFTDNGAWKAFNSRDGILWIGGTQGNIYRVNPLHRDIPKTHLSDEPVTSIYEDSKGTLWVGTDHELFRNDKKTGITKRYKTELNLANTEYNTIFTIGEDKQGNLWIGSRNGLFRWDSKNDRFINYKYDKKNNNSVSSNDITEIYEDSRTNFWIATARGWNLMDRETGVFERFYIHPEDTTGWGKNIITSILEDKSGKLWLGSWNQSGLVLFDPETKTFKNYLKGTGIMCLLQDSEGNLWAGGSDGLYKYDSEIDNFIRYADSDISLSLQNVIGLVEDNRKNLWLGTSSGIVRINPQRNETSLFGKNFGIKENSLTYGSAYKGPNGNIYFGNSTGYYVFNPSELINNIKPPEIIIKGFQIADQPVKQGSGGPLKESLTQVDEIRLNFNQNIFSFNFAVIDYANPEENRVIYYLENFDKDWIKANSEQKAYYFNISPGKYIFHVKAVNGYGSWAEKKIDIIVMPPWYRKWWAFCIYGLLIIAGVFGFDRFQRRRIVEMERQKNQQRELAQAKEIEKAYKELKDTQRQLIQAEKMASLGELTAGIAHEIQNPLNFVNNFSEVNQELLLEMNEKIEKGNLDEVKLIVKDVIDNEQKINHHGKRADAIVKGMLQHSRTSTGIKEPTDINALADEYLRLAYHGLRAKDKSFNAIMKTSFDENIGKINVIPQDLGRVILNLITNAFYAVNERKKQILLLPENGLKKTQPDYEPTVTVKTSLIVPSEGQKEAVLISISDNGNGIPNSVLDKIFQPFFTTKPSGQGTGLGLSMSYEIVTKGHGGELKVENRIGEGATFTIVLPMEMNNKNT